MTVFPRLKMSIQRSPPTGSQPDLSKMRDYDSSVGITLRKRKSPECEVSEFRQELTETFSTYRREMTDTLTSFQQNMMSSLRELLDKQSDKLCKLSDDLREMKNEVSVLQQTSVTLSKEIKENKSNISSHQKLTDITNNKVCILETDLLEHKRLVASLSEQLLDKEQQGRLNNLEISGIPFKKGENLHNILLNIAQKVGFSLSPSNIDYIHRVRRYPHNSEKNGDASKIQLSEVPNIVVRFTQRKEKSDMLAAVRARRNLTSADLNIDGASRSVFVNDHLAPHNKILFGRARKCGKELQYKYIWSRDCKLFLRKTDTSNIIHISHESDLNKIN